MKWLSHLYFRKRISDDNLEPFPAKELRFIVLDEIVLVVGVIGPLTTIPQILKIFLIQDATGVSTMAWGLSALFDIPWILYGLAHKERPITIAYIMWFVMNILVFIGALTYGAGAF